MLAPLLCCRFASSIRLWGVTASRLQLLFASRETSSSFFSLLLLSPRELLQSQKAAAQVFFSCLPPRSGARSSLSLTVSFVPSVSSSLSRPSVSPRTCAAVSFFSKSSLSSLCLPSSFSRRPLSCLTPPFVLSPPTVFSPSDARSSSSRMAWRAAARTKGRAACTPYARGVGSSACNPFSTVAAASSSAFSSATSRSKKRYSEANNNLTPLPLSSGLSLHKKFGQHLLKNPAVLDKITRAADLRSSDTVLEIGPGTGNLTMRLLPLVREVVALDVDARMVNEVKKRATSNGFMNLKVRQGDALRAELGVFDVCAANLPYQISSHFLLRLLAHRPAFRCAVLMFQKEFGERLMAQPGDKNYCRLAVNVSLFCTVQRVCKVEAKHFAPPPKVDSVVVKIVPRPKQFQLDFKEWDGLMRICFGRKNRTLQALFRRSAVLSMLESNYKTWCSLNRVTPTSMPFREYCLGVLAETNLRERRSISIDIDTYFSLLLAFNKKGIHFVNVASLPDATANAGSHVATDNASPAQQAGIDEFFFYDEETDDKVMEDEADEDS